MPSPSDFLQQIFVSPFYSVRLLVFLPFMHNEAYSVLVTNASFMPFTHVYDDCSSVHTSINGGKKGVLRLVDIFELGNSLEPKVMELRGMPVLGNDTAYHTKFAACKGLK
jgi:hypothetical protein